MVEATDTLHCPGRMSPVRPASWVPLCRGCALVQRLCEVGPHLRPAARHAGGRWVCANHVACDDQAHPAKRSAATGAADFTS